MQWPLPGFPTRQDTTSRNGSNLYSLGVTASGTANTKGAWTTYQTVPASGATGIMLWTENTDQGNTDTATLLDIGVQIGGGGNEFVVIPDLLVGFRTDDQIAEYIPVNLPGGSVVVMRIASMVSSKTIGVGCDLVGGEPSSSLSVPSKFTAYGVNAASSSGTVITPDSNANVKGAYSELIASTTLPIHEMLVTIQGASATMTTSSAYLIDIAVGAAGSERVVYSNYPMKSFAFLGVEAVYYTFPLYLPLSFQIPVGSRLSARCQSGEATGDNLEIAITGITY